MQAALSLLWFMQGNTQLGSVPHLTCKTLFHFFSFVLFYFFILMPCQMSSVASYEIKFEQDIGHGASVAPDKAYSHKLVK